MKPFRIVITGSRHWTDAEPIRQKLSQAVLRCAAKGVCIVEGGADGADAIARSYAIKHNIQHETFPADWARGRAGGPERNRRMMDAGADLVLAFPYGGRATSPGTWDCIEVAAVRGVAISIIPPASFEGTVAR